MAWWSRQYQGGGGNAHSAHSCVADEPCPGVDLTCIGSITLSVQPKGVRHIGSWVARNCCAGSTQSTAVVVSLRRSQPAYAPLATHGITMHVHRSRPL